MANSSWTCSAAAEDQFGPVVDIECLNGFDFTLVFEESILTILPLGVVLLLAPIRIASLLSEAPKANKSWLYSSKATLYFVFIALQATLVGLWGSTDVLKTRTTLAATVLTLVVFIVLFGLSHVEHVRSVRPSTLLNLYLGLSVLLDLARTRTLWFVTNSHTVASVYLAAFLVKVLILFLEVLEKRQLLKPNFRHISRESTSGIASRSLFLWINGLFFRGFRGIFSLDLLPTIGEDLQAAAEPEDLAKKWACADKKWKHALLWTFTKHYIWDVLAGVPPKLAWIAFSFAQPFLVQRVLDFISNPDATNTDNVAYGLIGAYAIVYIGIAITYAYYQHKTDRLILKFRGSLIALIFDKTLRFRSTNLSDASALTLFSQDTDRIGNGLRQLHEVWSGFIQIAISIWLLYRLLGAAVAATALFIAIILILGMPLANLAGNAQGDWLEAIEERLAVTSKALASMKAVKLTGAVDTVATILTRLREQEIRVSGVYRLLTTFIITLAYASQGLAPVLGFGTFIILSEVRGTETLTQGVGFAALTLFQLLDAPMVNLVDGLQLLKTVVNCFERIQEHLIEEERHDFRALPGSNPSKSAASSTLACSQSSGDSSPGAVEKPHFGSVETGEKDVNEILVKMVDASASWSEDAEPIVRNLNLTLTRRRTTMIVGPVGCGKSTLLKLILGEVPEASGQVAVGFKEAAFCSQSPWLKFGSIQTNIVGNSVWDGPRYAQVTSACNLLPDFEELPEGDQTKIGSKGSLLSGGQQIRVAFARALYANLPTLVLDDVLTGLDRRTEQAILQNVFSSDGLIRATGRSAIMATNSAHHLAYADEIVVLNSDGLVEHQGTFDDLSETSEYIKRLRNEPQAAVSTTAVNGNSYESAFEEAGVPEEGLDDEARRTGDTKVYAYYFAAAGWWTMGLYLFTAAVFVFAITFPTIWVQWWTLANDQFGTHDIGYWLGVYAALAVVAIVSTFASSYVLLMMITPKTAMRFHRRLLDTTTNASAAFLTATDTGTIVNRFSSDLELIDLDLPQVLETTIIAVLAAVAEGALVFVGSGYVAATIPGVLVVTYLIQNFYLRTSRQLRLLEIESKAPLFSHFLEVLGGLSSVRAFGWTENYQANNRKFLNESQKPYYLLFTVQRWLTLVLNLLVAGVAILLVAITTTVRNSSTQLLGVALFNVVQFGATLEQLITDWTQLEQSIGAVSRIRSYVASAEVESEPSQAQDVHSDWPSQGRIIFHKVSASYHSAAEPVLKEIDLEIEAGHKVAICGRTGSGKSSLVSTLLRLLEIQHGRIAVDDVDIGAVPRRMIRSRFVTLSQEPFFLHGDVRLNLDPQRLVSDDEVLIEALRTVRLWKVFEDKGGLDIQMDETMLSHGQRQLFCLARAICKPGSILVMDEPTSSVDSDTEKSMQQIIRDHCGGRTIIAIVHKLHSILDFDRVALLDKGRLVEYGNPQALLQQADSGFKSLFDLFTGGEEAEGV